jgi:hypothetical protein
MHGRSFETTNLLRFIFRQNPIRKFPLPVIMPQTMKTAEIKKAWLFTALALTTEGVYFPGVNDERTPDLCSHTTTC